MGATQVSIVDLYSVVPDVEPHVIQVLLLHGGDNLLRKVGNAGIPALVGATQLSMPGRQSFLWHGVPGLDDSMGNQRRFLWRQGELTYGQAVLRNRRWGRENQGSGQRVARG